MATGLSKSKIMSALQCPKRVHLEIHRKDLVHYSKATEAAFAMGHEVGEIAIRLYDGKYAAGSGTLIEYRGGSFNRALAQTEQLMTSMFRTPIYEATLQYDGVLVRLDVLLPHIENGAESWNIVEVKASSKLKPEHLNDCAIQAWVHLQSGYSLNRISLAHIDKQFVYQGDGIYDGLLVEHDLTGKVFDLLPSVPGWIQIAREAVAGPLPDVAVGQHCTSPYECPFMDFCWPSDQQHPVQGLGGGKKKLGQWISAGYGDIREVPLFEIDNETQRRIHRVTTRGEPELLPGARTFVRQLPYPRFYLDFETVAAAIPVWAGTRPYQVLPFQWSCHIERQTGVMEHAEFLDLSGQAPMRALAEKMIVDLEADGPVLMYTSYERMVIEGLIGMFPELSGALQAIIARLVDIHPVTKTNYYHPDMNGSWSIKAVLPTIAPDMDYARLEGISEGTQASLAYMRAIHPETTADTKNEIGKKLLKYCEHDTLAMVQLVHFFAGVT